MIWLLLSITDTVLVQYDAVSVIAADVQINVHSFLEYLEVQLSFVIFGQTSRRITVCLFVMVAVDPAVIQSVFFVFGRYSDVGARAGRSKIAFMPKFQEIFVHAEVLRTVNDAGSIPKRISFVGIVEIVIAMSELIVISEQSHGFRHVTDFVCLRRGRGSNDRHIGIFAEGEEIT